MACKKNTAEALKCYTEAAQLGIVEAEFSLGRLHEQGIDLVKDTDKAIQHYKNAEAKGLISAKFKRLELEAALKNDSAAQFHLGKCYLSGEGVKKDVLQGVQQLLLAADNKYGPAKKLLQDNSSIIYDLARDFSEGRSKTKNPILARKLYEIVEKYGNEFDKPAAEEELAAMPVEIAASIYSHSS